MKNFSDKRSNNDKRGLNHAPIQQKTASLNQNAEDNSAEALQMRALQSGIDNSDETLQMKAFQGSIQLQDKEKTSATEQQEISATEESTESNAVEQNNTGLPDNLKAGIEKLAGMSLDDVKVHYNSSKPAELNAYAYAQGTDIYIGPGQEKHLAHEAWHVVQQKEGRVVPTTQMKGNVDVNDDEGLEKEADVMGAKALESLNEGSIQKQTNGKSLSSNIVQMERFVGMENKHHLHIDINQDHYKFGNDKGSRIELGKNGNYKLDQLIVARNYLVENSHTNNGGQECIDELERLCQEHAEWQEGQEYVASWEIVKEENNPHVNGILKKGSSVGYERSDLENSFIQSKNETYNEAIIKLAAGNHYSDGVTEQEIETHIESHSLTQILTAWSGFDEDSYSKDELEEQFLRNCNYFLHDSLREKFPLSETSAYPH